MVRLDLPDRLAASRETSTLLRVDRSLFLDWPFGELPRGHYGVIYADPPWHYEVWAEDSQSTRLASAKYRVMSTAEIAALPVHALAATDCALFVWITWPQLWDAREVIEGWGFVYKTCAFSWTKANNKQIDMLREDADAQVGMGYWTRANSEVCLLATRGKPKRLNADVRQGIIEPRREHSRKPDCVPGRIERLVAGPYLELFARTTRSGWDSWGNQTDKFAPARYDPEADAIGSYNEAAK
jgi:N6-adenosine-specific RNA methylase IME4